MLTPRLERVDRRRGLSLTQQLVDVFVAAIEEGELSAGARLPATRALAQTVGVNQLTASRVYRRLQEMGLVVSGVGRGTFVREAAALRAGPARSGGTAWQTYVLPPERETPAGRMIDDLSRQAFSDELIALSAGYPPPELYPIPELDAATRAVLDEEGPDAFGYGPVEGASDLRHQFSELGRRRALQDDADCIVVTTGARQALTLATRAILRPGDSVACESPGFMGVIDALHAAGANVLPVSVDERGLDIDALEQLLKRHEIRLIALQSRLQNPTGWDLSEERRQRLVDLAAQHGFFILEDSVYADLRLEGNGAPSLRALDPDHVVAVDSLSKTVSPGLRAGWIAASGPVLDRLVAEKRNDDMHSPTLTQRIVARYLASGHYPTQLQRARQIHRERREVMMAAIEHHLGDLVSAPRPAGGASVWVTMHNALDEQQLYRNAVAAGVSFTLGSTMLLERPRATHLRLSFSFAAPELIEEGVRRLAVVARSMQADARQRYSMPLI